MFLVELFSLVKCSLVLEEVRVGSVARDEANSPLQTPVTALDTGMPVHARLFLQRKGQQRMSHFSRRPPRRPPSRAGLGRAQPWWVGDESCHVHLILGLVLTRRCHSVTVLKQAFFSKALLPHIFFSWGKIKLKKHRNVRGQEPIAVQRPYKSYSREQKSVFRFLLAQYYFQNFFKKVKIW